MHQIDLPVGIEALPSVAAPVAEKDNSISISTLVMCSVILVGAMGLIYQARPLTGRHHPANKPAVKVPAVASATLEQGAIAS